MKKKIFIIIALLLLTGCTKRDNINVPIPESDNMEVSVPEQIEEVNKYVDDNPITIGIYENDINLVKECKLIKQSGREIIFSFYYTNKENLENNRQKENWYKFFSEYNDIDDYKIGFNFSFYVGETKINQTILRPETFAFTPYFYIYIYDDINQPDNTFYSHLEETDVSENTIFSSIKIFLVEPLNITSPIKFTVFTYDDMDDFDENNNYRGNSKYEINIDLI